MRTIDFCGGTRARLRFEAVCKKSGVVQPSPLSEDSQSTGKLLQGLDSF